MTALQEAIVLSNRCVAALELGNQEEFSKLNELRDAAYLRIACPFQAIVFMNVMNGKVPPSVVDHILSTDDAS